MRSFTDILLRLGAICAAVLGLAAHYAWGDVISDSTGRFSANFPGRVETSTQSIATQAGPAIAHIFTHRDPRGTTYTVVYSDYPSGSMANASPDQVYEGVIRGTVDQTGSTMKSSSPVSTAGISGREAMFESRDRRSALRARYFLTGDRLYQVACEGSPGSETARNAVAFLDSFHIIR
jgi:hypothetical protein